MRTLGLFFASFLLFSASVAADRDGQVALGKNFLVFTEFGAQGMLVHLVPLSSTEALRIRDSRETPEHISFASLVTAEELIFLRWHEGLYVYRVTPDQALREVLSTAVPRGKQRVVENEHYDLYYDGRYVYLYNDGADWRIDPQAHPLVPEALDSPAPLELAQGRSQRGDWLSNGTTCVEAAGKKFCLVTSSSSTVADGAGAIFYDKLLIRRDLRGHRIESVLPLATYLETIH